MKNLKEYYIEIIRLIQEFGLQMPKKHGWWYKLDLAHGRYLELDAWNQRITLKRNYKEFNYWTGFDGEKIMTLGINWGGFESNATPEQLRLIIVEILKEHQWNAKRIAV